MTLPKRSLNEWVTVSKVAREIRTVFCEGPSDAALLREAAGYPSDADFRPADQIEFEPGYHRFDGANKLRVKALAQAMLAANVENARCLVDTDFGFFEGNEVIGNILVYTDGSNIVSSATSFSSVRGFLGRAYMQPFDRARWDILVADLKFAFACRYLVALDESGHAAPDIGDHLALKGGWVRFDRAAYLQAYIGIQGAGQTVFINRVNQLGIDDLDFHLAVNSNDFFCYIFGALRKLRRIQNRHPREAVRSAIFAALPSNLGAMPNIRALVAWAESQTA